MLNISPERISSRVDRSALQSFANVTSGNTFRYLAYLALGMLACVAIVMFLPWTQTIESQGRMTTLRPDQRPQTIHSAIAGRIERWYVQEGDFVQKGDTILHISEIKDEYFDPALMTRTEAQIQAKESSVSSYENKSSALDRQVAALVESQAIKLKQTENKIRQARLKIESDSIGFEAAKTNLDIAFNQYERMKSLYSSGLKSLTDLETRQLKLQEAQSKAIADENKLLTSRNELLNVLAEMASVRNEYADKIAKAQSEKYEALSGQYDASANVMKLENQFSNYAQRKSFYYVTAPQTGYLARVLRSGIGEVIKEGEELVSFMPQNAEFAVELFVTPMDLPLVQKGNKVRLQFDGWPALVFSGWPGASTGTFGGEILAVDKFISPNGKYRLLVVPDTTGPAWPSALQFGSGVKGILMLSDVPIWYELWRRLSGFPPHFYKASEPSSSSKSKQDKP